MKTTRMLKMIQKVGNSIVILMMVFSQFGWAVGNASALPAGNPPVITDGNGGIDSITVNVSILPRALYLKASASNNWVHAYGWTDETALTLEVDDPDNGVGVDHTTTTNAGVAPWDAISPVDDIVGVFDLAAAYDLQAGDELTVSGAGHTETYTVPTDMTQVRWSIGIGTGADPSQIPVEQQVVDDFNTTHPDIELLMEVINNATAVDIITAEIADGNAPDIVGPVGWAGSNSLYGEWQDLTGLITDSGFNTSQFDSTLVNWYHTDEGQVALPFAVYPSAIYYNPALFDAADINYPPDGYGEQYLMPDDVTLVNWSWETLEEVSKLLTLDGSGKNSTEVGFDSSNIVQYGFSFGWQGHPNYWGSFWQGGSLLGGTAGAYTAGIPDAWQAAWQWVYDGMWGAQPYIPNNQVIYTSAFDWGNVFASGKIAMLDNPFWYLWCCTGDFTGAGGTFQLGAMPTYGEVVGGRIDADTFRILSASTHQTEAFTALAYLVTDGVDKLIVGSPEMPPAYKAVPALLAEQTNDFKTGLAAQYPFVTGDDSWNVLMDGLNYPDVPSAESWMPYFDQAWKRLQVFGDTLSNNWNFNLSSEEPILEADLADIFNGGPAPIFPFIEVDLNGQWLHGRGWTLGTDVTVTIDDPSIGGGDDYHATTKVVQAPWNLGDPNDIAAVFDWPSIGVQAGYILTMTGTGGSNTLVVPDLQVIEADAATELVSGTAPDARVLVCANTPDGCAMRIATVDGGGGGAWQANYSLTDLQPGNDGWAAQLDETGNWTQVDWKILNPHIEASPTGHWVTGRDWPVGHDVTMTISGSGGSYPDPETTTVMHNPGNPGDLNDIGAFFNLWNPQYDLQPGDVITLEGDEGTIRSMTVSALQVTAVNAGTNTVSGKADAADGEVHVWVDGGPDYWVTVNSGHWTADFSPYDLVPGMKGGANQSDINGNVTQTDWHAQRPWIQANVNGRWVMAHEWPLGATLTMTINGSGVHTTTVEPNPWNPGDPFDTFAQFDNIDLQSGDVISITDGTTSKSYTVTDLQVTGFDVGTNTISGDATPGAQVQVCANVPGNCITRWVTADNSTGEWTADYSGAFDLQAGSNGWASEQNDVGDQTWYDWRILNPYIEANARSNWVHGRDWPSGTSLHMTIERPVGTITYTADAVVGQASWNSNELAAEFNLWNPPYDLQPGDVITMTDGVTSRSMTVWAFAVTEVDAEFNTVKGTSGAAEGDVNVWINNGPNRQVPVVLGGWTAQFDDIEPGMNGGASQTDSNGNITQTDWRAQRPWIQAGVTGNWVQAYEWPVGDSLTMTINGLGDYTATVVNNNNEGDPYDTRAQFDVPAGVHAGDLIHIQKTGGGLAKDYTVTALQVTEFDVATNTIRGIATPGAQVQVCANTPGNCVSLWVTANSSTGVWIADYTVSFDLQPGSNGWVYEEDSDSDRTWVDWNVPNPYISDIGNQSTNEDTATDPIAFTVAVNGIAAAFLNVTATSSNTTLVPNDISNITLDGSDTDRTITLTPAANQNGTSTITVNVYDGATTTSDTFELAVNAVNDAPAGTNKTITTLEDTAYTFGTTDFGFTDPNDSPANTLQAVKITTLTAAGSLKLSGVVVTAGQMIAAGSIPNLTFTPAANANGAGYTSFTFQVQDNGGAANGGVNLDPSANTITVDVTSVNDAPAGTNKTITTLEDTAYTFSTTDFGFTDPNDSQANTLQAVKITTLTAAGSLKLSGVVVTAGQTIAAGSIPNLTFTPAANANGAGYTSFTFQVQDNGGAANGGVNLDPSANTITVDVTSVNDAPIITEGASISVSMSQDGSTSLILHATDVDGGDTITWSVSTAAGHGTASASGTGTSKAITYTPALNYIGSDSFVVQVSDGNGGTDTITVNVTITAVEPPSFTIFLPLILH